VKINLDGLYDLLGSADARRQFEDSIIQRLRARLDWLKSRVDRYDVEIEQLRKEQDQLFESGSRKTGLVIDGFISSFEDFGDYNKAEWTAIIAILQALTGEDPGDNNPIDTEAVTKVLVEYRRWAKLVEWQKVTDGINSDGNSQTASISAAPGLNEAVAWATREIGDPGREVHWKVFCAKVWARCGVEPEANGYSSRTIRRLVERQRN
jgi:hypothetical protein